MKVTNLVIAAFCKIIRYLDMHVTRALIVIAINSLTASIVFIYTKIYGIKLVLLLNSSI